MIEKLTPMTEFVLEQKKRSFYGQIESSEILQTIYNYTEFLKQPLTLGMFIPCDGNGNILQKPMKEERYKKIGGELIGFNQTANAIYRRAQERVLFKDFNLIKSDIETLNHTTFIENSKGEQVGFKKDWEDEWSLFEVLIEDLIGFEIELTKTAQKQIYE